MNASAVDLKDHDHEFMKSNRVLATHLVANERIEAVTHCHGHTCMRRKRVGVNNGLRVGSKVRVRARVRVGVRVRVRVRVRVGFDSESG